MAHALVGSSGFVGSTLLRQTSFEDLYRSTNIADISRKSYEFLICAAAPAVKWKANQDAEGDIANLRRLMDSLRTVEADTAVLISTVDVYPRPIAVYEDTPIDEDGSEPYGRHRLCLEQFFATKFPESFIIRLPGLFGHGLRKNFLFDLLSNPGSLHLTHRDSRFQFYDMSRLWQDIMRIVRHGPRLVNIATPPVAARDVAVRCFGVDFDGVTANGPVQYDFRTRYAALFGNEGDYIVSEQEVFAQISRFVADERRKV